MWSATAASWAPNEAGTLAALKAHRSELIDGKIAEHQGRIVKLTGDGMLVEFPSVVNAVACAAEIQRRMRERNADVPEDRRIEFRVGIHLGDIIVEEDDIYGDGVNVAARIEGIAKPGGVAVSGSVRDNVGNRLDLAFEDMGEQTLKNIERPVRVYNVALGALPARAQNGATTPSAQLEREKPSIAVLPFTNMSGDPEQEYFSDGITEDIITDLSKISGLFVVGPQFGVHLQGQVGQACSRSAQELGVKFVLEGSVRKAGQRVRITGQLIDGKRRPSLGRALRPRPHRHLRHPGRDHQAPSSTSSRSRLLPEEKKAIERSPTENVEAYTYYLQGRQFLHADDESTTCMLARRMFAKAVGARPALCARLCRHAELRFISLFLGTALKSRSTSILATAAKALALDPNLAEAHAARGLALSPRRTGRRGGCRVRAGASSSILNRYEAHYFYAQVSANAQATSRRAASTIVRAARNPARRLPLAAPLS